MRVVGLFAGIGGIETGLAAGHGSVETTLLCEWWDPARAVLATQFPGTELHGDVADLRDLPEDLDLLTAGFPCTDLSQAGRTAGIGGAASGMVGHVFRLLSTREDRGLGLPDLLVENVPNMLTLDGGAAMAYLVSELENLGYAWAYRTVDSRFTGLPQRRRRVILLASTRYDPEQVLFADEEGPRPESDYVDTAFGFYWTEGNRGVGWAQDAVPTLKGSSTVGILSPPAIWIPGAEDPVVVPSIEDAEHLQGFTRGWTDVPLAGLTDARTRGARWKMVGNAVTTRVAEWVGERLSEPGVVAVDSIEWDGGGTWPTAAWGRQGSVRRASASEFPQNRTYEHLLDVVTQTPPVPLSDNALRGFTFRLGRSNLRTREGFMEDLRAECERRGVDLVAYGEARR